MESVASVPLLIIDDFGMRKLRIRPPDLLKSSCGATSGPAIVDVQSPSGRLGKLLGDVAAVTLCWTACCITARAQVRPAQLAHQAGGGYGGSGQYFHGGGKRKMGNREEKVFL